MDAPDSFEQHQHELAEITSSINIAFSKQLDLLEKLYPVGTEIKTKFLRNQARFSFAIVNAHQADEHGGKVGVTIIGRNTKWQTKEDVFRQAGPECIRWVQPKDVVILTEHDKQNIKVIKRRNSKAHDLELYFEKHD